MIKKFNIKSILKYTIIAFAILFFSLMFVSFLIMFDPNYQEFGPYVVFHRSKNCADQTQNTFSETCSSIGGTDSWHKKRQKTLSQTIERVLFRHGFDVYSQEAGAWECANDEEIIDDNTKEIVAKDSRYQCWPK